MDSSFSTIIFRRVENMVLYENKLGGTNIDEMKINLTTKFVRGIVANIVSKLIVKNLGIKSDISINGISIEKIDNKIHLHLDVDADVDENVLLKITRLIETEEEA